MTTMKYWLKVISIAVVVCFVSVIIELFFLPTPPLLNDISFSRAVYDEQHHLLRLTLSQDQKYRLFTPLNQIAPSLVAATLLEEDQYFYWHVGINPIALSKAIWQTYLLRKRQRGASTITMQVAHLRYGINSKTVGGKIRQILKAVQLEVHYSKKQILEAYLNLAPYGNNIEGVGAASLIYFNKPAAELTLPEALTLSVIPQNPLKRTPKLSSLLAIRQQLFTRWLTLHPDDKNKMAMFNLPLQMQTLPQLPFRAPHFVNTVLRDTPDNQATVITTLNLRLQTLVEQVTRHYVARKKYLGVNNAAVMLVDTRDMSIKAVLGSANFFDASMGGQINGTEIKRSPGSTLKPFIYGLALDQGLIHPDTVLKDVPHSFGSYNPENFDYDFLGPIAAKDALVLSRNIPAIYLTANLNHPTLYELLMAAHVSELKPETYYGLTLALGGAPLTMEELTSLYAMLANKGQWQPLHKIAQEVTPYAASAPLLSPEASFLVLDMLKNTPRLPNDYLNTRSLPVAWKTGTSSGYRDAWSVGLFGPYVLTVWIGNFNNASNPTFVGKNIAAPLLFELIDAIQAQDHSLVARNMHPENLNLTQVMVCKASGMLPTRYCHDRESTWFIPGKSPIKTDTIYREVAIDKNTGLRTCHFNQNTRFAIYEFWPSDLLKIFKAAGIERRTPPPYNPDCALNQTGIAPQITSPNLHLSYIIRANAKKKTIIPFAATADADVRQLYWFLDKSFLTKTRRDQPVLWVAKPGAFVVRVVDDHGRGDVRDIVVQVDK